MAAILLALPPAVFAAGENDWFVPLGRPPEAPPKRISGGEAFPPLPLPATPLRRSENKREPSPPSLFGKVVWGEQGSFTYTGGNTMQITDWNLCPADLQRLFDKVRGNLGLQYGFEDVSLASFNGNPDQMAVPLLQRHPRPQARRRQPRQAARLRSCAAACSASIPSPARPTFTTPRAPSCSRLSPSSPGASSRPITRFTTWSTTSIPSTTPRT